MNNKESFNKDAENLQKGDTQSAERIFDNFSGPIHSFLMARVRNRETAQDITQEVFLKVIKNIDQFDKETGNFTAWIWQIVRNTLVDFFRKKRPSYLEDLPDEGGNIIDESTYSDSDAKLRDIMKIIDTFPEEDQELFQMHFVADMSYSDIAQATGKSEPALRVAIHRLKKKIQPKL
ncbi:MAG: sigma-70 family RNA polymerase sigma factor [Patescibacteria group bacterium]